MTDAFDPEPERAADVESWRGVAQGANENAELDRLYAQLGAVLAIHYRRPFDYTRDLVTFGMPLYPVDQCDRCHAAWPCETALAAGVVT